MGSLSNPYLQAIFAFVVGACIGSFVNVCVYRIPLNRSVIHPGSHCAACGAPIPWYNNIPILSWLILNGRAACCGTRIDARYCLVETGMAFLFAALWLKYGPTDPIAAVIYAVMVSGLTAACLIDLDHYIIPDRFSLGGCAAGFVASTLHPAIMSEKTALQAFSWSLASAIAGALTLLAIAWIGTFLFKKEAMGMGDVKFLAAICSFLGSVSITWILPLSSLVGSVLGVVLIFWRRGAWGTRIPFGPFLGLAAILWLFGGSEFMYGYWHNVAHIWTMYSSPMVDERLINSGH
ncbi:MAG: prepilin peptidase [Methylacidiphilales bacterium]|nr:prepilin peptidase [Candidatus Methylacidiphilales bacterium]